MSIDATKTSPEKLVEMNDSLITDNRYLRGRVAQLTSQINEVVLAIPGTRYMDPPDGGDVSLGEQVRRMALDLGAKQAHIDALMIEYCPDEVTDEQWAEWCSHQHPVPHLLWETGEVGVPSAILDRNGEVVLGLCKVCGRGECELDEPCSPKVTL